MSPAASDILALDLGNNQTLMLIALVVIIASLLWHNARRRSRRTGVETRTGLQARKHNARLERQAGADIGELMLRLEELSREICGQIDTRFAKLEHVVTESDVKLAEMQTALRKCSAAGIGEASPPADPKHLEIYQRHQAGQAVIQIAREMSMTAGEVELILSLERNRRLPAELSGFSQRPAQPEQAEQAEQLKAPFSEQAPRGARLDEQA